MKDQDYDILKAKYEALIDTMVAAAGLFKGFSEEIHTDTAVSKWLKGRSVGYKEASEDINRRLKGHSL